MKRRRRGREKKGKMGFSSSSFWSFCGIFTVAHPHLLFLLFLLLLLLVSIYLLSHCVGIDGIGGLTRQWRSSIIFNDSFCWCPAPENHRTGRPHLTGFVTKGGHVSPFGVPLSAPPTCALHVTRLAPFQLNKT